MAADPVSLFSKSACRELPTVRILLISYYFPPYNSIGAVRLGKIAAFLYDQGHDVRVLTADRQPFEKSLPHPLPAENVLYTSRINLRKPADLLQGGEEKAVAEGSVPQGTGWSLGRRIWWLYRMLVYFPDMQVGWYPYAVKAGKRLLKTWTPDLIYASGMPFTGHLVARRLAHHSSVPWIGELRDLWMDNHYYEFPFLRRWLEGWLEKRTLGDAIALVTVSEPFAKKLKERFSCHVAVIMNGVDAQAPALPPPTGSSGPELTLLHAGMLYEGKRDPSPLFKALALLGDERSKVNVRFYGRQISGVLPLAKRYGVEDCVEVHGPVPHHESLRLQNTHDVLLLLLWADPREEGNYPGKLFEYLGSRRPVLIIGAENNVSCHLVQDHKAGLVLNDPEKLASQLRQWVELKASGSVASIPAEHCAELSRTTQLVHLEKLLMQWGPTSSSAEKGRSSVKADQPSFAASGPPVQQDR